MAQESPQVSFYVLAANAAAAVLTQIDAPIDIFKLLAAASAALYTLAKTTSVFVDTYLKYKEFKQKNKTE